MVISGKWNNSIVYTDEAEDTAVSQIKRLCNQEFLKDQKIRIMPDVHAGAGSTIGTTMTITDKVVPNLVGVDIGCGMETGRIKNSSINLQQLDELIYQKIPSGFQIREDYHAYNEQMDLGMLRCKQHAKLNLDRALKSLGTLGGGNHFIEVDKDEEGNLYLVIHSGSRHLGLEVATYYQRVASEAQGGDGKKKLQALIGQYKKEGREQEIQNAIKGFMSSQMMGVPKDLAYLSGVNKDDYIHDMKLIQKFAVLNRKAMMCEIVQGMHLDLAEEFSTIHNYIDTESMILRKGAVSAKLGEKLLIPINMRDGSLICIGKGNDDWNQSAPHGAGRIMSRTAAKSKFTMSEYAKQMEHIYTTSVTMDTLDECPMAYKPMEEIISHIAATAEVVHRIKPIYNFKAGQEFF